MAAPSCISKKFFRPAASDERWRIAALRYFNPVGRMTAV